jgi:hypothetical protein
VRRKAAAETDAATPAGKPAKPKPARKKKAAPKKKPAAGATPAGE